jgi:methionyl-tRNA formyltransferase
MRVVFLGTPHFALASLRVLLNSPFEVCAVFTQPDRPAGRGQKPQPPPVKRAAEKAGLPVYQPQKIRSEEHRPLFESLKPDFLVVVAFGQILPRWLLEVPKIAPVNVHASLLPAYRGAAPVARAILNGDSVTGVTTMLMEETLDTGPILLQKEVLIPDGFTCGELEERLANAGADLLTPTLDGLRRGIIQSTPQDHAKATMAPRISSEMGKISWDEPAARIHNQIRALNPRPVAFSDFRGQRLQIYRSRPASPQASDPTGAPGHLAAITQNSIRVSCGDGTLLELLEVQLPGRRRVSGRDFANGARLTPAEKIFG